MPTASPSKIPAPPWAVLTELGNSGYAIRLAWMHEAEKTHPREFKENLKKGGCSRANENISVSIY